MFEKGNLRFCGRARREERERAREVRSRRWREKWRVRCGEAEGSYSRQAL